MKDVIPKLACVVLDSFSSGKIENLQHVLHDPMLTLVKEDPKRPRKLGQLVSVRCEQIVAENFFDDELF
jgi:hypothetical protein